MDSLAVCRSRGSEIAHPLFSQGVPGKFKGTPEAIEEISGKEDAEVLDDDDVVELFNQMEHVTNFNSIEEVNKSFRTASRNYF